MPLVSEQVLDLDIVLIYLSWALLHAQLPMLS